MTGDVNSVLYFEGLGEERRPAPLDDPSPEVVRHRRVFLEDFWMSDDGGVDGARGRQTNP